ncbi:MAG: enoyl-CoA hydratase/isomerase family protein [Acidobacteria bacterium]|nr:enoyl-CoA hydratase/isomerase family protein [Acidobacteriota bacterium]
MSYENLLVEIRERIATVTINRPQVLNALNARTVEEMDDCWQAMQHNTDVGVVIVTGAGEKAFIAGADIKELNAYTPPQAQECSRRGQAMIRRLEQLGKPVIAAINGFALGGGCELALACTLRIASQNARIGQPEVKIGIPPGYGGSQRLPRLIGKGRAVQMILTGEPVTADVALQWGLVNQVVALEQLLPTAREIANKILANSMTAVRYSLQAVHQGLDQPLEQGLFLESVLFGLCFSTLDMKEGTGAFLEKRPPRFTGQ